MGTKYFPLTTDVYFREKGKCAHKNNKRINTSNNELEFSRCTRQFRAQGKYKKENHNYNACNDKV